MTKTISEQLRFPTIACLCGRTARRQAGMSVRAAFDGGAMSSDFGALLLVVSASYGRARTSSCAAMAISPIRN